MNALTKFTSLLILLFWFVSPGLSGNRHYPFSYEPTGKLNQLEPETSEFRAVWVATINNIDWPSRPNLTVDQQKAEFVKLLDTFEQFKMNVVILQVRAASDALYPSKTEPWSRFLTGKQGVAPQPYYDPLAWAIDMCHQRGMELHAWFNPFRVRNVGPYPLDPKNFAAKNPQYVREFDKKLFLDPGCPEVIKHVVKVIAEVAGKYDVDAVLLDDYFYPYPVEGKKFRDEKSFAKYGGAYFPKKLKDWRRNNINQLIASVHDTLKRINPKIKFGISPFGIWRNKAADPMGSEGKRGISSYDDLFADVRKWLQEGWIDYVIPQLYWENGNHFGDFASLLKWWSENNFGKPIYIGQALYKSTAVKNGWTQPDELANQINHLRTNEQVRGFAFYSASNLGKLTKEQIQSLCNNQLRTTALVDDNRRVATPPPAAKPAQKKTITISPERLEEMIRANFVNSLEDDPVSIRPKITIASEAIVVFKMKESKRKLSWQMEVNNKDRRYALLSYEETGAGRYKQKIEEISDKPEFIISAEQRKIFKNRRLLLVCRDLKEKSECFTEFFQLKRNKVKSVENPFRQ